MSIKVSNRRFFNCRFAVINAIAAVMLLAPPMMSAFAAEIRLKNEPIRCRETLVTLSDVAEILPAPGDDVQRLRQAVLFTAPAAGEEKTWENVEIRDVLSRIGISSLRHRLTGASRIVLIGEGGFVSNPIQASTQTSAQTFAVVPASYPGDSQASLTPSGIRTASNRTRVSPQLLRTLEQQVAEALVAYLNYSTATEDGKSGKLPWKVAVKLSPEQGGQLASNGQIVEIFGGTNPPTGRQRFGIRMQAEDPATGQNLVVTVDADVVLPREVLVVRRSLPKGFIIGPDDVTLRRIDNLKDEEFFVDAKEVVGMETVRSIGETGILTPSMLKRPTWIRKGDIVTIRAVSGGIIVRTEVTALADGCEGDMISVETINSDMSKRNRRGKADTSSFLARVSGPKTVEVYPTGNIVAASSNPSTGF